MAGSCCNLEVNGEMKEKERLLIILQQSENCSGEYSGGIVLGHTIVYEDKKFALRLIPSGIFTAVEVIMGNGMVITPKAFLEK